MASPPRFKNQLHGQSPLPMTTTKGGGFLRYTKVKQWVWLFLQAAGGPAPPIPMPD